MNKINKNIGRLEHAQICWAEPDIHATVKFFSSSLGIAFLKPEHFSAQDVDYGSVGYGE